MKTIQQKIFSFAFSIAIFLVFTLPLQAAQPINITLNQNGGDTVQIVVSGEAGAEGRLYYYTNDSTIPVPSLNYTTDGNGRFYATISSGMYGIPSGARTYFTLKGQQSSIISWPLYTSTLSLNQNSVQMNAGQATALTTSVPVKIFSNSNPSVIQATASNQQITLNANSVGSSTLNVCADRAGCQSIYVTVSGANSTTNSLFVSQNNLTLSSGQTTTINIYGGSNSNYFISSNSNPTSVSASLNVNTLTVTGGMNSGSSVINVCNNSSYCTNIYISNVTGVSNNGIYLSQNNITLNVGQSTNVVASGAVTNNYYVASNSNPLIASATANGNIINVLAGSVGGSAVVRICSYGNNSCADLFITNNYSFNTNSNTFLFADQNINLENNQTKTFILTANSSNSSYFLSTNSNPNVVYATIQNNTISLRATAVGMSTVTICSNTAYMNTNCGTLYIIVTSYSTNTSFPTRTTSNNLIPPIPQTSVGSNGFSTARTPSFIPASPTPRYRFDLK